MAKHTFDPLLTALRAIVIIAIGFMCLVAFVAALALPSLLILQDAFLEKLSIRNTFETSAVAIWSVKALLAGMGALAGIGLALLWRLMAITDTVRAGDPFDPVNADRLGAMGWLSVAAYGVGIALVVPGPWLAARVAGGDQWRGVGDDVDIGGIVLTLVLFVLARVFRQGAAMREDLDGTV